MIGHTLAPKTRLMDVHSNAIRHKLPNIRQKQAAHAADDSKRNRRVPHILQRVCVRPLSRDRRRPNDSFGNTRHSSNGSGIATQQCTEESLGVARWKPGFHSCDGDGGEVALNLGVEDV